MTKPKREAAAAKSKPKPIRKVKPVVERTIVTRAANANRNPNDLEVVSSEAEVEPPKMTMKRKKKVAKSQEELDTEERQRDAALATVSHLEVDMERQAKIHDGTPRTSFSLSVSRHGSYVAPDPPAISQAKARVTMTLSATEEESDVIQPRAKRPKSVVPIEDFDIDEDTDVALGITEEASAPAKKPKTSARVKVATDEAKQAGTKRRFVKSPQDDDFDKQMDVDSGDEEEEEVPLPKKKVRSAAHVGVGKGKPAATKRQAMKSIEDAQM
ncbi:hypothetical protein HWV62_23328, partial [Athelia sp. TMB]